MEREGGGGGVGVGVGGIWGVGGICPLVHSRYPGPETQQTEGGLCRS